MGAVGDLLAQAVPCSGVVTQQWWSECRLGWQCWHGDGAQPVYNPSTACCTSSRGNRGGSYGADWRVDEEPPAALGHLQECCPSSWVSFGAEPIPVSCQQEPWAVHSRIPDATGLGSSMQNDISFSVSELSSVCPLLSGGCPPVPASSRPSQPCHRAFSQQQLVGSCAEPSSTQLNPS